MEDNMINTTKKIISMIFLTVIVMLTNGCEDITTTMEIFPDGSCRRTIVVKSDSNDIFNDTFFVPKDPSWTVDEKWEIISKEKAFGGNKQFVYTAKKFFPGVSELNDEWSQKQGDSYKAKIDITLEKRFVWFFTYFSYREIYRDFFPFRRLPLEEYFSPEELKIVELYLADEDKAEEIYPEDLLEKVWKKFDTWATRAIFEEFYLILLEGAKKLNSPDLKPELIVSQKEALFNECRDIDIFEFEKGSITKVLKKCAEVLQTPDIMKIREQNKNAFSQYEGKLQALDNLTGDEFTNKVMMPGLITDTNAGTVKGRKVTWKFSMGNFFLTDYEMWVTSRRVNWWVVGIAAFLLILVIAALIAGTVIRRKRRA
jgi:hypothetical protein